MREREREREAAQRYVHSVQADSRQGTVALPTAPSGISPRLRRFLHSFRFRRFPLPVPPSCRRSWCTYFCSCPSGAISFSAVAVRQLTTPR